MPAVVTGSSVAGASFCVSYQDDRHIEECKRMVRAGGGLLLLDNGAFSHWRSSGGGQINVWEYWMWANWHRIGLRNSVAV